MPLGTGKPLPRSAIIANEDFFSHAKVVLRRGGHIAKRCFPPDKNRVDLKKGGACRKKGLPVGLRFLQFASNRAYYEYDDCRKTLPVFGSASLRGRALRAWGQFERRLPASH
jgi:hypothetical protein